MAKDAFSGCILFTFSRQRYVLGDHAMKKMASSSVLVYGMGGVGIEIGRLDYLQILTLSYLVLVYGMSGLDIEFCNAFRSKSKDLSQNNVSG